MLFFNPILLLQHVTAFHCTMWRGTGAGMAAAHDEADRATKTFSAIPALSTLGGTALITIYHPTTEIQRHTMTVNGTSQISILHIARIVK